MARLFQQTLIIVSVLVLGCLGCKKEDVKTENQTELVSLVSGLLFAEGPAYYNGNLFFSDIEASKIYKWSETAGVSLFRQNTGRANDLYFNSQGNLYVCEGGNKRIVAIDANQNVTVITDSYGDKPYNEPNDIWVSPTGNVYFTDPVFTGTLTQDGQNVYCVLASTGKVIKVISDLVKPNGIIGNTAGSMLYVADFGASKIYQYSITSNGSLENKLLFADIQADGLTIDNDGNVYTASKEVMKYSTKGVFLESYPVTGTITNLCFVNTTKKLFITTHTQLFIKELSSTF